MGKEYKTKVKKYSEEDLEKAIYEVKELKAGVRAIAAKYNIDKSLLSRRVLNKCTGTQGRKTALSERDEQNLASNLKIMAKWGFPLSRDEVLSAVQEYVEINGIKTPFKNGKPGHDWFKAFRARNNLTLKKPHLLIKTEGEQLVIPL